MLICDTIKECRRRGPRVVYVEKLSLSKCYQTLFRRARKKSYKYFFKNTLKIGKSVQKKVVKLYYRKIEGNRDLPADDRTKANSYSTFLLFIVLTFPVYGVSLYFLKIFSFRRFDSARPLLVRFFSSSPCQIFLYSILFFSGSPYSFLGSLFFL